MANPLKIVLVYPQVPANTYWSFKYALNFVKKKSALPPLGLVTLAALIPRSHHVRLVDMNVQPLADEDILWADAVFISAMIVQKTSFEKVVARCNAHKIPVVAGGPYPTSSHKEITGVDHFLFGEVEDTLSAFLEDFAMGNAQPHYRPQGHPDIAHTVIPRFDLLKAKAYGSMAIQYSRGCPFHCEFCDIWKMFGNKMRLKSSQNIIAELDALHQLGWKGSVFFVDDNFIGNKRRLKTELLPALVDWQQAHDYVFQFYTEASINLANDEDLMQQMQAAGFNQVFIGIETPSAASLKETGKIQNLKTDMATAVAKIQRNGLEVMGGFILGFDNDPEDIFDRQIDFIQNTGIVKAMVGLLNALPGTDLYRRLKKEGRIVRETCGNNTHDMTTNFRTRMDARVLQDGYKRVLGAIYDKTLKNYFDRCNKLLDRIEKIDHFQRKLSLNDIAAVLRSFMRQPFTPYGFRYLTFIIRNFVKNRRIFGEAMVFAIEGHHFFTITQETLKVEKLSTALDDCYRYFKEQTDKHAEKLDKNRKDAYLFLAALWRQQQTRLDKIRRKIDHVHVDFQKELTQKYTDVSTRIKMLKMDLEADLGHFRQRVSPA